MIVLKVSSVRDSLFVVPWFPQCRGCLQCVTHTNSSAPFHVFISQIIKITVPASNLRHAICDLINLSYRNSCITSPAPLNAERSLMLHSIGAALKSRFRSCSVLLAQPPVGFAVSDFILVSSGEINPTISSLPSTSPGSDGMSSLEPSRVGFINC